MAKIEEIEDCLSTSYAWEPCSSDRKRRSSSNCPSDGERANTLAHTHVRIFLSDDPIATMHVNDDLSNYFRFKGWFNGALLFELSNAIHMMHPFHQIQEVDRPLAFLLFSIGTALRNSFS